MVTPRNSTATEEEAIQIARFLLSINENKDPSDGIKISETTRTLAQNTSVRINTVNEEIFIEIVKDLDPTAEIVTQEAGILHMRGSDFLQGMYEQGDVYAQWLLNEKKLSTKFNQEVFNNSAGARLKYAIWQKYSSNLLDTGLSDTIKKTEAINKVLTQVIDTVDILLKIATLELDALGKDGATLTKLSQIAESGKVTIEVLHNGIKTVHTIGELTKTESMTEEQKKKVDDIAMYSKAALSFSQFNLINAGKDIVVKEISSETGKTAVNHLGNLLSVINAELVSKGPILAKKTMGKASVVGRIIDVSKIIKDFTLATYLSTNRTYADINMAAYDYMNAYYISAGDENHMMREFSMPKNIKDASAQLVSSDLMEIALGDNKYTKRLGAQNIINRYMKHIEDHFNELARLYAGVPSDELGLQFQNTQQHNVCREGYVSQTLDITSNIDSSTDIADDVSLEWSVLGDDVSAIYNGNTIQLTFGNNAAYASLMAYVKKDGSKSPTVTGEFYYATNCVLGNYVDVEDETLENGGFEIVQNDSTGMIFKAQTNLQKYSFDGWYDFNNRNQLLFNEDELRIDYSTYDLTTYYPRFSKKNKLVTDDLSIINLDSTTVTINATQSVELSYCLGNYGEIEPNGRNFKLWYDDEQNERKSIALTYNASTNCITIPIASAGKYQIIRLTFEESDSGQTIGNNNIFLSSNVYVSSEEPIPTPNPEQNSAPQVASQSLALSQDVPKSVILTATDADGDTLSYTIVSQPLHGTLSGTAPNLTYTPTSGYSGIDSFTFKANDGKSDSNIATITLSIAQLSTKQVSFISESAPLDNATIERGRSFTKSWTFKNSGNVALSDLSVTTLNAPSGVEASVSQNVATSLAVDAQTTYGLNITVPQDLTEGTYEASFKLVDGAGDLKYENGNTAIFSYKFVVKAANDFKSYAYISSSSYQLGEATLLSLVINDGNAPYTATINWGDGSSTTEDIQSTSNAVNLSHTYASAGDYTITTQIVDALGKTANITNSLEVLDAVKTLTKWSVSGANLETSTSVQNIAVTTTAQTGGYATYETSWTPQESSQDYWLFYKLPIPNGIFKMDRKIRLTLASQAGELADHDRALTLSLSDGKSYNYNIMSSANSSSGFIRIKDFQGSDTKRLVASLTDSVLGVKSTQRLYAIESIYEGVSSSANLSAYKYEDATYSALADSSSEVQATATLKEIGISYKGNGTTNLIYLEYDKNGDGEYGSDEKIILNTENMEIDWSAFVDDNETDTINPPVEEKLFAHYQFNNLNNLGEDSSGNGYDLTINNTYETIDTKNGKGIHLIDTDVLATNYVGMIGDEFTVIGFVKLDETIDSKEGTIFSYTRGGVDSYIALSYSLSNDDWEKDGVWMKFSQDFIGDGTSGFGSVGLDLKSEYVMIGIVVSGANRSGQIICSGWLCTHHQEFDIADFVWQNNNKINIGGNFKGIIDDLRVYSKALTQEELNHIKEIYYADTPSSSSVIKKTGQTKSYDASGTEVTDGSLKDDGYYQTGLTSNYTRASDTVTDELTGLMWQDDAEAASVTKPWLTSENYTTCSNDSSSPACYDTSGDTAATYCSELSLGGYTDWRLPTAEELEGIVDYGKMNPAIDATFTNSNPSGYWSSTTLEDYKFGAWIVYFGNGNVGNNSKDGSSYVRCVRAGQ